MSPGLEEWKRLSRRVLAMSPKELADRLGQLLTARLDFLRYKAGISFEPRLITTASSQAGPRFFFSTNEIPRLCSLMRELFPQETSDLISRAERICQHRFDLLGYQDLDYGPEINWHADQVHGKVALKKPWFQIRFLDFAEVGDSKITWELNRHQHLVTLARAYRLSGQEKFAAEIFQQWNHWHRENPYPMGINWASSLEVAFRSLSWLWVYYLMSGSAAMPAGFRADLIRKLAVAGRHIETYLSTYFSPNTHLLGEGVALFFIGTLCPGLQHARQWQNRGWAIVRQEAERQVRDDGFHFEESTYYHVYALDFFLHAAVLASLNGIAIPAEFERTLERMCEVLYVLGRAGPIPSLGDDDGGRLFDPWRNRAEHLLDPLATGAVLFGRGDFKSVAGGLREETLWLLGEAGVSEFNRLPAQPAANNSTEFKSSGLYVMGDKDLKRQLVIDAGPQGAHTAGHGDADALSVTANMNGHAVLIDSGTFEYVGENLAARNRFRGTKAHNTLVVDGLDQSEPKGPFSWVTLPNVRAERWIKGETFDFFVGSHDGYTRLPQPVVHRRFVFSYKSRFWLIRDQVLGKGKHQIDLFWHIDPQFSATEKSSTTFRGREDSFCVLAPQDHGRSQEIRPEDYSPAYGRTARHMVLHFGTMAVLPSEFATLLLSWDEANCGANSFARGKATTDDSVVCYRFTTAHARHLIVFGQKRPWSVHAFNSDAELLYYCESEDKKHRTLICCNGTHVMASGQNVISSGRSFSRCEVLRSEGQTRVIPSDDRVVVNKNVFDMISVEGSDH